MVPNEYTYPRYLRSKRTVDDRALNRDVMDTVLEGLPRDRTVRIAELGGGVGTMVDRLIESGSISRADYLIVDASADFLEEVDELGPTWLNGATRTTAARPGVSCAVSTHHALIEDWVAATEGGFDLVIAHAVLDLVDVQSVLPTLLGSLDERGQLWATINFDGDTIFMPRHPFDDELMAAYHLSMDTRTRDGQASGSSTAGRELFLHVRNAGGRITRAGSSDWVVFNGGTGYVGDEAYFAHHIIHTVEQELSSHPVLSEDVKRWGQVRHGQVETGELVYIAHQLDFAIRRA